MDEVIDGMEVSQTEADLDHDLPRLDEVLHGVLNGALESPNDAIMEEQQDFHYPAMKEDTEKDSSFQYKQESEGISAVQSRQYPIEVVLTPPPDPEKYERIPLSWTVDRVVGEVAMGNKILYNIELDDGRIDQVAYDDILALNNGRQATVRYQEQRFSMGQATMHRSSSKRPLAEDDYYDSDSSISDYATYHKKRARTTSRPTRRSTRQASRQASADTGFDGYALNGEADASIGDHNDNDDDDDNDGEEASFSKSNARNSEPAPSEGRMTRSKDPAWQRKQTQIESDDELAQTDIFGDDYDAIPIIRSDLAGPKRTSARKRRRPATIYKPSRNFDSDSSIEFEASRRSRRSNRTTKSMQEADVDDDDYVIVEDRAPAAPKYAAVRETFQELPEDSLFRRFHADICETCRSEPNNGRGPLIYCQGCSLVYHKTCLGVRAQRDHRATKVATQAFVLQCKFCVGHYKKDKRAPDYSMCQDCRRRGPSCAEFSVKKTPKLEEKARLENGGEDPITPVDPQLINNADNVLFRCSTCKRGYHFHHLPPLTEENVDDSDIRDNRLEEYSLAEWKCKDCLNTNHKIHALVAWRPADQSAYKKGQRYEEFSEDDIEYLVKWEGRSHFHDLWMSGAWVYGVATPPMRIAFHKRTENQLPKIDANSAIEEEWLLADVFLSVKYKLRSRASTKAQDLARINDIVSVFVKFQGLSYEEAVWDEPPPRDSGAPWDAFCAAYDEYLNGKYFPSVKEHKMRERIELYRSLDFRKECELRGQPPGLQEGCQLMEYQMEGVNWLLYNFHQQLNVILADEMGLGKTVQIVAFITALVQGQPQCWPFLIVVPNSTCPNWRRELKKWAPALRVVTYHGGKAAQDLAYRHELFPDGLKEGLKAHVVIMSYEAASNVKATFQAVKWAGLIVDEGQRLKNEGTQLYRSLLEMNIPCRILLTGTPLQNNKRELFNLLQFIDPSNNAEELDAKYLEVTKENLKELHMLIRPYFLRRTKVQVLKFLPPMAQIILPITMTVLQEKLSKSIMSRNPELIKAIISKKKIKAGERKSLNNILADLRQCLCHPFCFSSEVEDKTVDEVQMHRNLVAASPKLLLLDIMLPKLKERGHRVLIFSQFLQSLTIIEDFLTGLGLAHDRIDGSLSALEKQKKIDAYNAPDSPLFAMLLSTRAGGVGINLATADTVIVYDPDFNPHQDIQALSRAHRIGQKKKVLCFQLMTKNTVEEKIMQMGRKKMALDHALIESMDAKDDATEDLESILKHGAEALFSNETKDKITYDSMSVDKLLDRSQIEDTSTGDDQTAESQFSFARVWANDEASLTANVDVTADDDDKPSVDPSVWENILKLREEEHERELAANQKVYGRGARRRVQQGVDYNKNQRQDADSGTDVDAEDELYIDNDIDEGEDESDAYGEEGQPTMPSRAKSAKATNGSHTGQSAARPTDHSLDLHQKSQQNQASNNSPKLHQKWRLNQANNQPYPTPSQAQGKATARPQSYVPPPPLPSYFDPTQPMPRPSVTSRFPSSYTVPTQTMPPNFMVSIPRRESGHLTGTAGATLPYSPSNVPLPIPQRILKSTQTTTNTTPRPHSNGNAKSLQPGQGSDVRFCVFCSKVHSLKMHCIDFNSEVSLRLAIDSLRAHRGKPGVEAAQAHLIDKLRQIRSLR
ncbi:PHD/FYVE-zinc-finger like domain-containing protein [Xylariaceae sp. FL0662B]|nr:PHD/FYVE-zinc-finger like domain-containing protein [Xylariaceae sp. FL0662B]